MKTLVYLVVRQDEESPEWSIVKAFTDESLALAYRAKFNDRHREDAGGGDYHEYRIRKLWVLDYIPEVRWSKRMQDYQDMDTKKYLFER